MLFSLGCKNEVKQKKERTFDLNCNCSWDASMWKNQETYIHDSTSIANQIIFKNESSIDLDSRIKKMGIKPSDYSYKGEILFSYRDALLYMISVNQRRRFFKDEIHEFHDLMRDYCKCYNDNGLYIAYDTCTYRIDNNLVTLAPNDCFIGKKVTTLYYTVVKRNHVYKELEYEHPSRSLIPILPNETYIIKDAEVVRLYKKGEKPIKKHGKGK
jgi:hypothetical protein